MHVNGDGVMLKKFFCLYSGNWFHVPDGEYTWTEGKAKCESMSRHLAYIKTPEQQEAAKAYLESVTDPNLCGGKYSLVAIVAFCIFFRKHRRGTSGILYKSDHKSLSWLVFRPCRLRFLYFTIGAKEAIRC